MTDEPPPATSEEPPAAIDEFHAQDWLIVIEALAAWAGNPSDPDLLTNPRKGRAWDLMSTIASERGLPEGNPLKQVDETWGARKREDASDN
jgi:hypothetical protein